MEMATWVGKNEATAVLEVKDLTQALKILGRHLKNKGVILTHSVGNLDKGGVVHFEFVRSKPLNTAIRITAVRPNTITIMVNDGGASIDVVDMMINGIRKLTL